MKHTPGPWKAGQIYQDDAHRQGLIYAETTGENVAVSYDAKNAALIAAAPELLETTIENALEWEDLLVVLRSNPTWGREKMDAWIAKKAKRMIENNRAAIAKATE